jgi:hypothetical protein
MTMLPAFMSPELLRQTQRRFVFMMDRRMCCEPESATQLLAIRDKVLEWYDMEGAVIGVRFVAGTCCESCYRLDGMWIGLLDVRHLVSIMPPLHHRGSLHGTCGCTVSPVLPGTPDETFGSVFAGDV